MPRPQRDGPTDRELDILQVLWEKGPSTTRDIVETLNEARGRARRKAIAYNSVLTILSIMHGKELVSRDETQRSHVYTATRTREEVEGRMVQRLIDDVFGGSAMRLVSRALSTQPASPEEAEAIQQLLDAMRGDHESDR